MRRWCCALPRLAMGQLAHHSSSRHMLTVSTHTNIWMPTLKKDFLTETGSCDHLSYLNLSISVALYSNVSFVNINTKREWYIILNYIILIRASCVTWVRSFNSICPPKVKVMFARVSRKKRGVSINPEHKWSQETHLKLVSNWCKR